MAKNSPSNKKADARQAKLRRERRTRQLTWGGVILLSLAVVGGIVWLSTRQAPLAPVPPALGEVVAADSREHIPVGSDPGPYSSDPPAGGHHYPVTYDPGFYSEQDAAALPEFHQGYLVHNLEHGYVIYWYNCQADPKIKCDDIKNAIRQVITENNTFKVIGFPWPSQKEPLDMTAWGRILRLDHVDLATMRSFYKLYVDQGPEKTAN